MTRRPPRPSRTRRITGVGAVLAVVLLASACGGTTRSGDPDLQVRLTFEPSPPVVGVTEVRIDVADVDWSPRNGARVVLSGARDGITLVTDTALGQGAGRYVAAAFRFEVAGDWVLTTRVDTPDGRWVEVSQPLTVETPPSS